MESFNFSLARTVECQTKNHGSPQEAKQSALGLRSLKASFQTIVVVLTLKKLICSPSEQRSFGLATMLKLSSAG